MFDAPYALTSRQWFFGREGLMRKVLANEQAGQSMVLIGGRRCGKTSVLERTRDWLLAATQPSFTPADAWKQIIPDAAKQAMAVRSPHVPFLVSFEGLHFEDLDAALLHLATTIKVQAAAFMLDLSDPPKTGGSASIRDWMVETDRVIGQKSFGGLALLVDEIEALFEHDWCHDLMSFLRLLDDRVLRTRVVIVVAGSDGLDRYKHPGDGSPPLNVAKPLYLEGLDYQARRRMLIAPFEAAGRLPPKDETALWVDRWAAGNPWLLNQFVSLLLQLDGEPVGDEIIEDILDQSLEVLERWAQAFDRETDGGKQAWLIYQRLCSVGRIKRSDLTGSLAIRARRALEYQALAQRVESQSLELGPELFRKWAKDNGRVQGPFEPRPVAANDSPPPGRYPYDVALSYASSQKQQAADLERELSKLGLRVFYDDRKQHELLGVNLDAFLPTTYDRAARLVVLLVSHDYAERHWTMVETRAAIAKALREGWRAVLPVSLDGTRLTDLGSSLVWLDLTQGKTLANVAVDVKAICSSI